MKLFFSYSSVIKNLNDRSWTVKCLHFGIESVLLSVFCLMYVFSTLTCTVLHGKMFTPRSQTRFPFWAHICTIRIPLIFIHCIHPAAGRLQRSRMGMGTFSCKRPEQFTVQLCAWTSNLPFNIVFLWYICTYNGTYKNLF